MEIKLTPEQVDAFVREAILKPGIVKAIEDTIAKNLTSGYNSPVDAAVKNVIQRVLEDVLQEPEWKEKIRAAVVAALTARVSEETLAKIASVSIDKIEAAARDRFYP